MAVFHVEQSECVAAPVCQWLFDQHDPESCACEICVWVRDTQSVADQL